MSIFAFTVGSFGDILTTAGLAVKISQALYGKRGSSNECQALMSEVGSLYEALISSRDAVKLYKSSPLGQSLSTKIFREVDQCHLLMWLFLDNMDGYRKPLLSTVIGELWHKVWWNVWETDELAALRTKLSARRETLNILSNSLNL